jgi:hypothetical protein
VISAPLRATGAISLYPRTPPRFEALEQDVCALRQELSETQERLDFTERLLTKAREEKRVGG